MNALLEQVLRHLDPKQVGFLEAGIARSEFEHGARCAADVDNPAGNDIWPGLLPFALSGRLKGRCVGAIVPRLRQRSFLAHDRIAKDHCDLRRQRVAIEHVDCGLMSVLAPGRIAGRT